MRVIKRLNYIICAAVSLLLITGAASLPVCVCEAAEQSTGLIAKCSLSCTAADGGITITAKTQALRVMSEIGCTNIVIQSSFHFNF